MTDTAIQRTQPTGMEQPTTMQLIQQVLATGGNTLEMAQVVKELVALRQSEVRFAWEGEERQDKKDFDDSLKSCQEQIGRIAPNRTRENNIAWADYAELDRILRPIYTKAGFAIAYSECAELRDGKVMLCATLSRSGQSKPFYQSVTPAGNSKMNAADMEASGQSRAMRYLLIKIFNIAIGIDADEKKPFGDEELNPWLEKLAAASDSAELNRVSLEAIKAVKGDTESVQKIGQAKNKRMNELRRGNEQPR